MTITKKDHTPAYKLFHYPFNCKVATMHVRTEVHLELYGTISTGDRARDAALALEPMDIIATVKQMADYHSEGAEIILTNPEDSVRVYDIIVEFMSGFDHALSTSLNVQVEDKEFFRTLDSLATEVYKVARRYIPTTIKQDGLFEMLDRLGSSNPIKRGNAPKITMQQEHKPLSDSISIKALERERLWRR